jgi:hypothetical protein
MRPAANATPPFAYEERDRARHDLGEMERERDHALAARSSAIAQFEDAVRERGEALRERDRARTELEAIVADRDQALDGQRRALAERDAALGRGSGFPAVSAADLERQPHSPVPGSEHGPRRGTAPRLPAMGGADPMARAVAATALIVLVLVVLVLLKVA